MINKRFRAFGLSLVFLFSSVVPVRQANAVIPIAVGLTMQAFGTGGAVVSSNLLTSGVSALIGGVIFGIAMSPTEMGDGTNPVGLRIPTIDTPSSVDLAMPPPSAPLSSEGVTKYNYTSPDISGNFTTAMGVCSARSAALSAIGGGCGSSATFVVTGVAPIGSDSCSFTSYCQNIETGNQFWGGTSTPTIYKSAAGVTCPAGYSGSGSTCALSNARAAVPDGKTDAIRSASGYSLPTTEQDADGAPAYASSANGVIHVSGRDSGGRPVKIEYAVSPDGTKTYVTHYTQTEAGGQSVVQSQAVTIDSASGAVTGVTAATAAGSIQGVGTVAPTVVTTGAAVLPADITFPSDYARSGEAAAAANVVKTAVDALADPLKTTETLNDPLAPDYVDPWNTTFSGLKGWALPGHSSSCPVGSFDFNGSTFAIDAHCQLIQNHFGVLQGAMYVVWVVLALFVVLGA